MPRKMGFLRPRAEDHVFRAAHHFGAGFGLTPADKGFTIKDETDLTGMFPVVLDQGDVGDCTANGGEECMEAALKFYGLLPATSPRPYFSRYFTYAMTRKGIMGVPLSEDTGATITDMVRSLIEHGACPEAAWPSNDPMAWMQEPSVAAKEAAVQHRALRCYSLNDVPWIRACLSLGFPVVFGVSLFESFESIGPEGFMPMPDSSEDEIGGHCMILVGYRRRADGKVNFLVQNSWGADWGSGGRCWMPQEYFESQLACDAWTVHEETGHA